MYTADINIPHVEQIEGNCKILQIDEKGNILVKRKRPRSSKFEKVWVHADRVIAHSGKDEEEGWIWIDNSDKMVSGYSYDVKKPTEMLGNCIGLELADGGNIYVNPKYLSMVAEVGEAKEGGKGIKKKGKPAPEKVVKKKPKSSGGDDW